MKLFELFITETTEEDRAIISLASSLWHQALKYRKTEQEPEDRYYDNDFDDDGESIPDIEDPVEDDTITLGKLGKIVKNNPLDILNNITIKMQTDYGLRKWEMEEENLPELPKEGAYGYWDQSDNVIVLNKDRIAEPKVRSAIAHELRHALDDYKSDNKANVSSRYTTPKNKSYRGVTDDPYYGNADYGARPNEINARFIEVLNSIVPVIEQAIKNVPPERLRSYILGELDDALSHHAISQYFPEKTKSPDYKRLLKRAVDFIEKEIQHHLKK